MGRVPPDRGLDDRGQPGIDVLVLIAGQLYTLADRKAPGSGISNVTGLPGLAADVLTSGPALTAVAIGA